MGIERVNKVIELIPKSTEEQLKALETWFSNMSWSLTSVQDDADKLCDLGYMKRVYKNEFIWSYKIIRSPSVKP